MTRCRVQGKRRFADEALARAMGAVTCAEYGLDALSIYHCPHCRGWHLTRLNKGRQKRVTADETFFQKAEAA